MIKAGPKHPEFLIALGVIGHEAAHLAGVANENEADRWGMRWAPILRHRF